MKFNVFPSIRPTMPEKEELDDEQKAHSITESIGADFKEKDGGVVSETSSVSEAMDAGAKAATASNQLWKKSHLIGAFISIWLLQFIIAFCSGITGVLTPYVTSDFQHHSLTATTGVISSMVSGLAILPYAKLLNVWGRPQCFAVMMASMTLGLVLMAACQNVETYCAAQVFYYVGYTCVNLTFTIFIADTTSLKNRALVIAFESSPWIITVWVYGYTADSILNTIGFRWGFGIFAIILPLSACPLFGLFYYYLVKARKAGLIKKEEHNRTFMESVKHWIIEFDVVGLLLIITGLALFLLAFSLYAGQALQWKSPLIICFIIIGALLIIGFALYEKYYAPVTFIPWKLMTDRTVFFTFTMAFFLYMGWYNWDSYFYSYLIVVNNLTIPQATYVTNIYTIGSCVWCLVMGAVLRFYGKLKWHAVVWGVPLTILGCGLMIHFRQPDVNIGFICMCQIFIAFGGGTLVICEQMTVMAVSEHQYIPSVLAMENMWIKIGSAIGSTIASAIWQGVFPQKLAEYLPADALPSLNDIYSSITVQSSYAVGTPERDGINQAYASTQRYMLICATCMYVMCWFAVFFWRDIDVKKQKKIKGQLF